MLDELDEARQRSIGHNKHILPQWDLLCSYVYVEVHTSDVRITDQPHSQMNLASDGPGAEGGQKLQVVHTLCPTTASPNAGSRSITDSAILIPG